MSANGPNILVLGTPEHEGRMVGRAFEILGVEPRYSGTSGPVIPDDPRPDVVLLSREWSLELRLAAAQARAAGIPTIYVMDGVLEWAYLWENWSFVKPEGTVLQPLIAEHLCAIGRHPARILAALGLAERVHLVGLPRLDDFKRERRVFADRRKQILITTAATAGQHVAHKVMVRSALRDLQAWFATHDEIVPIWRVDRFLADDLGIAFENDVPIQEQLATVDGVISFTSTVLLESMLLGVPTAQIDYRSVPQYVQTAWEIRSAEQIESVIRELLHPPAEKIAFQEFCLRDELELGDASQRLATLIRDVVSSPQTTSAPAESLGILDYRQVHSHLSTFSLSPLSRVQYELDATYKLLELNRTHPKLLVEQRNRAISDALEHPILRFLMRLRMPFIPGLKRLKILLLRLNDLIPSSDKGSQQR